MTHRTRSLHHTRCARYSLTNQLLSCANARIQHPPQRSAPGEPRLDDLLRQRSTGPSSIGLLKRINTYLVRWARRKFKRLRSFKKAKRWWNGLLQRQPALFTHWAWMTEF